MDPLHDFAHDLQWVFDSCRDRIKSYPPVFHEAAAGYLERYNVLKGDFNRNYIFFGLPFWLGKALAVAGDICREVALANVLSFFYILAQDAVMDTAPGEYKADLLPLGGLFYLDAIDHFRRLFPGRARADSLFWRSVKRYFREWAESTRWERDEFQGGHRLMDEADLTMIAHKAAPVKIVDAAMGILSGKPEVVEPLDAVIDRILITSQFLDDCADWQEDFQNGNCTYFLSQAMRRHNLSDFGALNESLIVRAVYYGDVHEEILAIAEKNHTFVKKTGEFAPYLAAFHEKLLNYYREYLGRIRKQKTVLLSGGLGYWLYRNHSS